MSRVLGGTYGIGTRSRNASNRIHRTASIGRGAGLVAGCHRRWQRRPSRLTSDHYFEAELERPIRLQVVAGPRNQIIRGVSDKVASPFVFRRRLRV